MIKGILIALTIPLAVFEVISLHSVFAGSPAVGAYTGLVVFGLIIAAVAFLYVEKPQQPRLLSLLVRGIFDRAEAGRGQHTVLAKPGFAVSAIEVRADDHVNALRVQFATHDGSHLDLQNSYWSDWYGSFELGERSVVLESYYEPVVGLSGNQSMVLNSVGLLLAKQ